MPRYFRLFHCRILRACAAPSAAATALLVAALAFHAGPHRRALAQHSGALPVDRTSSSTWDAIHQNTPGESEGYAVGVPRYFAWCSGSYKPGDGAPPADFTAVTAWGQVYPETGAPPHPNADASIIVANAKTSVRLRATQEWILVQDQAADSITGAHYVADFANNANKEMRISPLRDGSVALTAPPTGFNTHFWLTRRGTYEAGSVDGVYVQMDMRIDAPDLKLVANVGADWWRNSTAPYASGFANNPGAGMSNWIKLSTRWSTLRFYSGSNSQFLAHLPPQLAGSTPQTAPTMVRRRANDPAPCLSGPQGPRS